MPDVRRLGVVVPACDEEDSVAACLDSVLAAARHVDVPVEVVVVVNGSHDSTAEVARACGVSVVVLPEANVGAARRVGARLALEADGEATWLAFTDADSIVPPEWLATQLACAADGADVVLGTVVLPTDAMAEHPEWVAAYRRLVQQDSHRHVHGASIGVRGTAYRSVGGFRPLPLHEDVDLITRLEDHGASVVRTVMAPVVTSARTTGRVLGGVATDLAAAEPPSA